MNVKDKANVGATAYDESQAKTYAEAKAKAYTEAKDKGYTEAQANAYAKAQVDAYAEAKARSYADAKAKGYANAQAKAYAEAKAKGYAKATAKSLATHLYDLAVDCLRLTMYFFHPIQQCAQQVYHSALPLSPTSSQLRKYCLQSVIDNQLSHMTAFSGAPDAWGLLLRTIDVRPKQLTCVSTSIQKIITACEDIVNIYDAVTFVLQQSLCTPETVAKIQDSPDGSTLFFAHSSSVTIWDVQTGGLIHTFTTPPRINDIAVSTTGVHLACGSSDGSIVSWNIHTKEGSYFGNGQPVVTICWLSPVELAVVTQNSIYVGNATTSHTSNTLSIPGHIWGMVYLGGSELLVGTSPPGTGGNQKLCSLEIISYQHPSVNRGRQSKTHLNLGQLTHQRVLQGGHPPMHLGQLTCPTRAGNEIVCITPPSGVQLFDTKSHTWANNPTLLDAATSVAVSLNRNLVVQDKNFIQIFSIDALRSDEAHNDIHPSHVYPLGENHIICIIQPNRHLALLNLATLRELHPNNNTSTLVTLLTDQSPPPHAPPVCRLVTEFGISVVMQAWVSHTPLPEWVESAEEDAPLSGLSPECTRIVTLYNSPRRELRVKDAKDGIILANLPLEDVNLGMGEVYNLAFGSETRFYLKMDGPGGHTQIPHDIIASPSGNYSHTITKGEPELLSEPRVTPPYSLDVNCEWVVDAESRKICWVSPGNIRRGSGGHFWAGLSLVMVGDDGVVRKLSFKEPDC